MINSLHQAIERAELDEDILALVVYGSYARGEEYRDIDVALVIWPEKLSEVNTLQKEIDYSFDNLDVHIFQELPLYIQSKILEEGDVKLMKSYNAYFDFVMFVLREWDDFKQYYYSYLEEVLHEAKNPN